MCYTRPAKGVTMSETIQDAKRFLDEQKRNKEKSLRKKAELKMAKENYQKLVNEIKEKYGLKSVKAIKARLAEIDSEIEEIIP
jgi:hypothetical protein